MQYEHQRIIDGKLFDLLVSGSASGLYANLKTVNDLNVFPIPDGDTGDNMFRTLDGGLKLMRVKDTDSVSEKAKVLADGMLLNARGNSGVILSQLFSGIAKGFEGVVTADLYDVIHALEEGTKKGYASVLKPVEGTILTVFRETVEALKSSLNETTDLITFAETMTEKSKASLKHTPELLKVLKDAGVVDSGGAGLVYMAEGLKETLNGKTPVYFDEIAATVGPVKPELDFDRFTEDSVLEYGYCTEFLLRLQTIKTDVKNFDVGVIIDYLSKIGDSIVAVKTDSVVKIHVHTKMPYKALEFCQQYGEFLTVKIENMSLQHNNLDGGAKGEAQKEVDGQIGLNLASEMRFDKPRKKFGLCAVATGDGIKDVFIELGADEILDGGQGKNPSTGDFIEVFDRINADCIFVLPNNSNIILAATQASEIYDKSKVYVIPSKNVGQAYAALSMLDYTSDDADAIAEQLKDDMSGVDTGMVTYSIRDTEIDGVNIKKGDFIGFTDKKMLCAGKDKTGVFFALTDKLGAKDKSFMTAIFGKDVTDEEKQKIRDGVSASFPDVEFYEIDGGQEVYDFITIIE